MNRGYSGFYKGVFLRSSYEYAYVKYLDYIGQKWKYEVRSYDLGYKIYKPDFFLYNCSGDLEKIIEVKSRDKRAIAEAQKALQILSQNFGIQSELVSYNELLEIHKGLPYTLNAIISEWNKSNNTTINKSVSGCLNAHFNQKHTILTKQRIGENTKKIWESESAAKQGMLNGLRKSGLAQKGKIKVPRHVRYCPVCGSSFTVLVSSNQKFCKQACAGHCNIQLATQKQVEKKEIRHEQIKQHVIQWAHRNKEVVNIIPLNKVKTYLSPMIDEIHSLYGVKDLRIISASIFSRDLGRKELLKFMRNIANKK
ncbi:restriction endonuclease [Peribacillus kribbensis]|uniref:restriction endonuclease n=1 Tax=Peribacillus kribbensis TaxID=356658 RepID=UPI0003FD601A|nr:restriction endonuclease [Peribacillus kribbensis]